TKEAISLARIIAVANQKGGVGKTTTVVNLGACLAQAGQSTLVVDIDPQAHTTSGLGLVGAQGATIYEVIVDGLPAEQAVMSTLVANLRLLPANIDLAGAEVELVGMIARE